MPFFDVTFEADDKKITLKMEHPRKPTYSEASLHFRKSEELNAILPTPTEGSTGLVAYRVVDIKEA